MSPKGWIGGAAALCALLLVSPARAEMFQYKDDQGNVHFVDSVAKIPPKFRRQTGAEYDPEANQEKSAPVPPPSESSPAETAKGAAGKDQVREQRERLREITRKNCAEDLDRFGKRLQELAEQHAEWSAKKKAESQVGESRGLIYCPGGNSDRCVKEHEEHEASEEAKRYADSPYRTQIETVKGQIEVLKRECRE